MNHWWDPWSHIPLAQAGHWSLVQLRYRVVTSNKTQRGHIYAVFCLSLSLASPGSHPAGSQWTLECVHPERPEEAQYTWPRPAYLATLSWVSVCHTLSPLTGHQARCWPACRSRMSHYTLYFLSSSVSSSPEVLSVQADWPRSLLTLGSSGDERASEISLVIQLSLDIGGISRGNDSEPSQSIII